MARAIGLPELASRHRSPEARRAAVALAALVDAARRFPGVPGIDAIADASRRLEEASGALADAGGPQLPGLLHVAAWSASRRAAAGRGERRIPSERAGRSGLRGRPRAGRTIGALEVPALAAEL